VLPYMVQKAIWECVASHSLPSQRSTCLAQSELSSRFSGSPPLFKHNPAHVQVLLPELMSRGDDVSFSIPLTTFSMVTDEQGLAAPSMIRNMAAGMSQPQWPDGSHTPSPHTDSYPRKHSLLVPPKISCPVKGNHG